MKKVVFLLLFFTTAMSLFAQNEWREVTKEELQMKTPKVEPDADAEAIFWEVRIDDSSVDNLKVNHYVRVKIFTERGREQYSKVDIPFTQGMKIKNIAARVIKPDGSIVEVPEKDIFEREIVKVSGVRVKAKSFAVPSIQPGTIVEYRYTEVLEDESAAGMKLELQKEIPVQSLVYYYKPYNQKEPIYYGYNTGDAKFEKHEKGFHVLRRANVPSFKEEAYMPPEDNIRPWVRLQRATYSITDVTALGSIKYVKKDPNNTEKYWAAFAAEKQYLVELMNESSKDIKKIATELTASAKTDDEKLQRLYEFCQTQIRNISFETSLTDEERKDLPRIEKVSDALKHKVASSRYIDLLFGALANALGYETAIVFSGNKNEVFFDPRSNDENLVHRAAVAVKVGNDWKFFNPGLKFLPYGKLVWYEQGVWALLIGKKNASWKITPMDDVEQNVTKRKASFKLSANGALEGDVQIEFSGQEALTRRLNLYDEIPTKQEEIVVDEIKRRVGSAEISEFKIENLNDNTKPLIYRYKVKVPDYAQVIGRRVIFQPNFFTYNKAPYFSSSQRKYHVFFRYPWSEEDEIQINLPEGFTLDSGSSPGELSDSEKVGVLDIKIAITNDKKTLIYKRHFHFGKGKITLFEPAVYQALKQLFDLFHKSDSHALVLLKQ